ncbi:putative sugar O-methyltransferase [Actinosynnema sp. NPDC023587]|uniref:putative sugar O-methyltransferase n=1 Tax=Actinosynnema sp. NPDC023587 TaxID=3154695 RepID=UPI0033C1CB10
MGMDRRRGDFDPRAPLPPGAVDHLRWDNPILLDLVRRYREHGSPVNAHSQWAHSFRSDLDLRYFRGDNCYLRQLSNFTGGLEASFTRYADYLAPRDARGLLELVAEDGGFGCWAVDYRRRRLISRDLLESVNEIGFLDRAWNLFDRTGVTVLDIGAGYGRLGHRVAEAVPGLDRYYCVDAVPESTFVCSYYLDHRGVSERVAVVPLDELDSLAGKRIDLAVNIHSFSEMPHAAIRAWLEWLAGHEVPALFVISNTRERVLSREADNSQRDATPLLARYGYRRVVAEPIVAEPAAFADLGIDDHFLLFRRSAG